MRILAASIPAIEKIPVLRGEMALEMGLDWDTLYPGWRPRFAKYWRNRQGTGNAQVFVASTGETTTGIAIASIEDDYRAAAFGEFRGYVNCVYVVPKYRSHGIARQLMTATLEWLRHKSCVTARLRSSDTARSLYAELGFKAGREMELNLSVDPTSVENSDR